MDELSLHLTVKLVQMIADAIKDVSARVRIVLDACPLPQLLEVTERKLAKEITTQGAHRRPRNLFMMLAMEAAGCVLLGLIALVLQMNA